MVERTSIDELTEAPHAEVFEEPSPRTVRLHLEAGETVPRHSHPGTDVVCYVVDGTLEIEVDGEPITAAAGDVVRFSGDREVSPEALEDARAILVFAPAA